MDWNTLLTTTRTNVLAGATPAGTTKTAADTRSEFQRDYDRSLFSTPVRRLQDKAQVFPLEPNDSVRTRLTHSLEVSNVAKGIASRVVEHLSRTDPIVEKRGEEIVVIAATCGLIHDLGNPPFGHAGEDAMRDWFRAKLDEPRAGEPTLREKLDSAIKGVKLSADFDHFDGNAQTIRLVSKLQMLADFDGLSLTAGTFSTALKYVVRGDAVDKRDHAQSKPGFFFSESALVEKVQEVTGTGTNRNPITYIVEAADDIVYSSVDLEDGVKKGALTWETLCEAFKRQHPDFVDLQKEVEASVEKRLRGAGLELSKRAYDEALAQLLRTYLIGRHVNAAVDSFIANYDAIMAGTYTGELLEGSASEGLWRASKRVAGEHVFPSSSILRLELMGRHVIRDLMDIFWGGVTHAPFRDKKKGFPFKIYSLLSENYRHVFDHEVKADRDDPTNNIPVSYRRLQLVADYICGMTDSYATALHRELMNG